MFRSASAVVALGCASVVLAGCTSGSTSETALATIEAYPTATQAAESSSDPGDSTDEFAVTLVPATPAPVTTPPAGEVKAGRFFAFVKRVDVANRRVTYDEAQFLTGDAANKAAEADKQEVPVPNDYYFRNVNKRLRTAAASQTAVILGSVGLAEQVQLTPKTLEDLRFYASLDQSKTTPFWITVDGSLAITRIEEQYLP